MVKSRQEYVDELINGNKRAKVGAGSERLFNCEVCWTCKFFKVEDWECFLTYEDARSVDVFNIAKEYFIPTVIKKPEQFRCIWWSGNG